MVNGSRLLRRHLTASGKSLRDFASEVGTSASLVWMWRAGTRTPGVKFALAIEQATAGGIRPQDWLPAGNKRGQRVAREASAPRVAKRRTES